MTFFSSFPGPNPLPPQPFPYMMEYGEKGRTTEKTEGQTRGQERERIKEKKWRKRGEKNSRTGSKINKRGREKKLLKAGEMD